MKIWDLFQYLKIDPTTTTTTSTVSTTDIPITSKIYLNDQLIDDVMGKLVDLNLMKMSLMNISNIVLNQISLNNWETYG